MYVVIVALVIAIIILWSICLYKTRIIENYERSTAHDFKEFIDTLNKLLAYLDLQERASREPLMRGLINEKICEYSRKFKTTSFEELIQKGCQEYVKKELNTTAGNENV